MSNNVFFYNLDIGTVAIAETNGGVCRLFLTDNHELSGFEVKETLLLKLAATQLQNYLAGKEASFDLSLILKGTVFQKQVWQALLTIPLGETRSYAEIAAQIGKPSASRAVGTACGRNPVWIVVPCHRVLRQDGALGGYAGGLAVKEHLLELEQTFV